MSDVAQKNITLPVGATGASAGDRDGKLKAFERKRRLLSLTEAGTTAREPMQTAVEESKHGGDDPQNGHDEGNGDSGSAEADMPIEGGEMGQEPGAEVEYDAGESGGLDLTSTRGATRQTAEMP